MEYYYKLATVPEGMIVYYKLSIYESINKYGLTCDQIQNPSNLCLFWVILEQIKVGSLLFITLVLSV